ncbi:hypothetical protein GB931_11500 [Modestobacter sp. I12A-02628]|uniref:Uncharacterized protein n=1 Tax=Goekera deserti TaxID=2497753 RepID=A0A7K3WCB1_9ACTN|nr:hypothetical protein [Goekera deserti]MPQ98531.1 hypothetical protein [Goekera deserti]NDI48362.1 hypothetical protein [Goekera deserti]NEL54111.1 hypothetical protein [Goekera deserti]
MSGPDAARPVASALRGPWWRWLFLLPGLAAVAYGTVGLLGAGGRVPLLPWATWFVGSALVHDLLIAPLWMAGGWLVARFAPRAARPAVVTGALVSGVLVLVALPFVLGYGYEPTNPSFLPRGYGRNLLVLVAAVLAASVVWAVVAVRRAPSSPEPSSPEPSSPEPLSPGPPSS